MLSWLAEQRIEEAMRRGEFEGLPGKGKPVEIEDLSHVPEELRVAYKILKNAGTLPEELQLQGECIRLEDLIAACEDKSERQKLHRQLNERALRLRMLLEQRGLQGTEVYAQYGTAIRSRLNQKTNE
ncbi:DUF1992 domain-containing protein [Paenibacillus sp. CAA11]|uniref:DnaJ family domain-containing protein n=1 Tax=Paenibacillus sp. CAA11 TaxID=1532905 RepID=UPI000D3A29E2|nr:DnaJ family domain-containing protein [Paenibacillus sp. CAA11]AWB44421.1 DUF1992 domain-containing protein [Paenibacillus sp. CAA11]